MRLRVTLNNPTEASQPINYQRHLAGVIYGLLGSSDAEYARFLHDEGYRQEGSAKRFKFFTFSWLKGRRRIAGQDIVFAPGRITWYISSPVEAFLTNFATGLLTAGSLRIGPAEFAIEEVQVLPTPAFAEVAHFICLSPIVASVPLEDRRTRYVRPIEGAEFAEVVRKNLLEKYRLLHGESPADDGFEMIFDQAYLSRDPNRGEKLITFKETQIKAAFVPFMVAGSPELIQVGYDAGFGVKNAAGFGMVEVKL